MIRKPHPARWPHPLGGGIVTAMSKRALWDRIHGYNFEHIVQPELRDKVSAMFGGADASTQAFASKLAVKLGWSRKFALRAIEEYKKFVYLGNIGVPNVTPSRVIDKVWHEHILFSRGYREFCRDVLQRDFDHNPELVPMAEQSDVFAQQYLDTLDAYRTEFNALPPADFWSVPKFREVEKKRAPKRLEHAVGRLQRRRRSAVPALLIGVGDGRHPRLPVRRRR